MASELTVQTLRGPTSGANANTVLIPSSQTLHAPGHVLQVVSAENTVASSATSSSAVNIISVNITPKSNTSKIYVTASINATTASGSRAGVGLYKGSSPVVRGDAAGNRSRVYSQVQNGDTGIFSSIAMTYFDSPATTSQITYSAKMEPEGGSTVFYINRSASDNESGSRFRGVSNITVMEIAQ